MTYIWLAERGKIYTSKEAENIKYYVKHVFWKLFKKPYKTIKESISSNAVNLFYSKSTQRALGHSKGHSKGIQALKALGHLSTWGTRVLRGTLDPWELKHLKHSGTWRALRHSGTRALGHSKHSKHFI